MIGVEKEPRPAGIHVVGIRFNQCDPGHFQAGCGEGDLLLEKPRVDRDQVEDFPDLLFLSLFSREDKTACRYRSFPNPDILIGPLDRDTGAGQHECSLIAFVPGGREYHECICFGDPCFQRERIFDPFDLWLFFRFCVDFVRGYSVMPGQRPAGDVVGPDDLPVGGVMPEGEFLVFHHLLDKGAVSLGQWDNDVAGVEDNVIRLISFAERINLNAMFH